MTITDPRRYRGDLTRPYPESLAFRLRVTYRPPMEGTAAAALAAFVRAHPEMDEPCCTDGIWHAFLPVGDNGGGIELHGRTEAELLGKLQAVA